MATGSMTKNSKKLKKLHETHQYYSRKVDEITEERKKDRGYGSKEILMRLKKTKLAIKDSIESLKKKLELTKK